MSAMRAAATTTREVQYRENDIETIHHLLLSNEVIDGPPELRAIVAAHWPELLHKVKPPYSEMH
jgi:hypothetical protein